MTTTRLVRPTCGRVYTGGVGAGGYFYGTRRPHVITFGSVLRGSGNRRSALSIVKNNKNSSPGDDGVSRG